LLNHVSGTRSGVAGIYNRALYFDEKKEAIERWSTHFFGLLSHEKGKVITLKRVAV